MSGIGMAGLASINPVLLLSPTQGLQTMSLLGRLWQRIWDREELNKQAEYGKAVAEAYAEQARHTEIQRVALKYWSYFQSHGTGVLQSGTTYLPYNSPTTTMANQATALMAQTYANQLALQNSQLGQPIYTTLGGGTAAGMLYPGQAISTIPGQVYLSGANTVLGLAGNHLDTFFMTLRGIEEWAKENKVEYAAYDNDALRLSDTREFNPQNISLLGLASFCLANIVDLDDIIILLEGHGLGVA